MTQGEKKQTRWMRAVLFWVFVLIFVAVAVIGLLDLIEVLTLNAKVRPIVRYIRWGFLAEVVAAVMLLFKVVFGLKRRPVPELVEKPVRKVDGKYKYEIICSDNKTTYQGECVVKQDGRALAVNGEQTKVGHGIRKKKISFHWFSNWAELCVDNKVRLDYSLANNNGGVRGYAVINIGRRSATTMSGELHLLGQPYTFGTIKFKKA
jgi:hypothetical protein